MTQPLRVSLFRAVLIVGLTAAGALSQTPSTPSPAVMPQAAPIAKDAPEIVQKDAPAVFKARVDMVSVPVVVRDAKGKVVGTLTKDNFQVFDRGKPQEIVRFSVEKSGDLAVKAAKTSDSLAGEGETAAAVSGLPERFVAYLFDDMHLPFPDLVRSRDAASHQLAKLAKTDRAAIYTTSGQNQLEFTDDIDKLQATLLLLRNRSIMGGVPQCPDISYFMADRIINYNDSQALNLAGQEAVNCMGLQSLQQGVSMAQGVAQQVLSMGQQETHVTMAVLRDVVRRMTGVPGQRIIVLVSPGFIVPQTYLTDESDILDRAIKSNVLINSMDARGLWVDPMVDASQGSSRASSPAYLTAIQAFDRFAASAQADVLASLAYGTGGSFFQNNNDLDDGMRQLAGAPEFYYLLGFAPQNLKLDGSLHSLKVTVKTLPPVSFNVQARQGYYAPKKASNAEETAKEEIEDSVFSREELSDLPVELHTQFFKNGDKDATLSILCRMDPRRIQFRKADGRNINVLTVVSAVFDRNGNFLSGIEKTVHLQVKDETMAKVFAAGVMTLKTNFTVPMGSYMVRLVVRDSEGQLMSALNGAVAIQ